MLNCESCGAIVHDSWEYCRRCGADAPSAATVEEPRAFALPRIPGRPRAWLARAREATRSAPGSRLHAGVAGLAGAGQRLAAAIRTPRYAVVLGLLGVALLAVFVLGMNASRMASELDDREGELAAARVTASEAREEVARLSAALANAEQSLRRARTDAEAAAEDLSALRASSESGQQQLASLEREVRALRDDLEVARSSIGEYEEQLNEQFANVETLSECLSGYAVALQFAREGQWASAERALEAVSTACQESQRFL